MNKNIEFFQQWTQFGPSHDWRIFILLGIRIETTPHMFEIEIFVFGLGVAIRCKRK